MDAIGIIIKEDMKDEIIEIIDRSKGCDQNVFVVTTKKSGNCVIKMPRKAVETRPAMHSPLLQAEITRKLKSNGVAVPEVIKVTSDYLIEEYVGTCDWSERRKNEGDCLQNNAKNKKENDDEVLDQLGRIVRGMHQIKTQGFSYMSNIAFVGKRLEEDGWMKLWKEEYFASLADAIDKLKLTTHQQDQIKDLYYSTEDYLRNFNDPRLLHCDITPNNIRLTDDNKAYLIDFADCMCGDPLMDVARIFIELKGDWSHLNMFLSSYSNNNVEMTEREKGIMKFYAVGLELWLDSGMLFQLMQWT